MNEKKGNVLSRTKIKPSSILQENSALFINKALQTNNSINWRLLDFFSNHFSVTSNSPKMKFIAPSMDWDAIAPNLTGHFGAMLTAVVSHPAMLLYLNNEKSIGPDSINGKKRKKFGLNENLAREILELHTLGVHGGYKQTDIIELAKAISGWSVVRTTKANELSKNNADESSFDVVIVGAGSAGIATASSLLKRKPSLSVALIDPAQHHYYQPGWTMVGGGLFNPQSTQRQTETLIPGNVTWLQQAVMEFSPRENLVVLKDSTVVHYQQLVVAPGLELHWAGIEGLEETLGKNGVTSNYRYDLAPYTWDLVSNLKKGNVIFTQPPMPIKCAGAPQKAVYLSADHWLKQGCLSDINVSFYNSGGVLFGVSEFVPALTSYMEKYQVDLQFTQTLIKVDGESKTAWFKSSEGEVTETNFDMLHVCPPQRAPEFIRTSPLADSSGWLDVKPDTLQHAYFDNVWGAGDVMNTANAKTMAAARKQAPVVAQNICNTIDKLNVDAAYDGYGACPLTVERGKIVLAEFAYGGKLKPTFPEWLNKATKPTRLAWFLKASLLPFVYWNFMLKGREWFTKSN